MVKFISPDKAGLLSTVLESILYGFSVLMFILTMWVLIRGRGKSKINIPMVVVSMLLFILSTIHIGVDINRLNSGFIVYRDSFPGGPAAWFANPSEKSFVFKNAVYTLQTVLGDGVVIFRCYKVWQSFWIIVIPCILWCGVAIAGSGSVYTCTTPLADPTSIYALQLGRWIKAFYSTTLACNFTATALLSYKLWSINKQVAATRVGRGVVLPVLLIVIDAGVLYSVTLVAALTCFALNSNGQYVVLDMVTPIISIAFYLVILRIGVARSKTLSGSAVSTLNTTMPRLPLSRTDGNNRMKIQIDVEQEFDQETREEYSVKGSRGHAM
ncbi:hypothetical protein MIND_01005200 [Mycena indigotica]|uniref:Uncharacterized protein n=1 Tax=Mycena indigotica TaxID=2126181 RepID=A0A8H6S967_9AGAR|nr:uncharacterized protein MIND_01005200 [Mycena indigotica]KAF7294682.1 hypothetical protein MIND_01005200 [Mycena indigotica]